jgi:hypothetical protein
MFGLEVIEHKAANTQEFLRYVQHFLIRYRARNAYVLDAATTARDTTY